MDPLDDGIYDGIVVDAADTEDRSVRLELAISSGSQKGNTVVVNATAFGRDALDLLGLPVTLTVADGKPTVRFD